MAKIKKHEPTDLYAGIVRNWNGQLIRASWHGSKETAIKYAEDHAGIVAVEHIHEYSDSSMAFIWQREAL